MTLAVKFYLLPYSPKRIEGSLPCAISDEERGEKKALDTMIAVSNRVAQAVSAAIAGQIKDYHNDERDTSFPRNVMLGWTAEMRDHVFIKPKREVFRLRESGSHPLGSALKRGSVELWAGDSRH